MTNKDFDIYINSIDGLINGNTGVEINSSYFFEIDSGWNKLVKDLIEDLIKLGWDKEVCQVKQKFGGLRFYINDGTDEIFNRISKAEDDSFNICEITGKPGKIRKDIGWIRTLSDEEYLKLKN